MTGAPGAFEERKGHPYEEGDRGHVRQTGSFALDQPSEAEIARDKG